MGWLLERRIDVMHVVVVVEGGEKIGDFLALCVGNLGEILRHVANLGGEDVPSGGFQRLGDGIQVSDLGEETCAPRPSRSLVCFERFHFLRTGFDGIGLEVYGDRDCRFEAGSTGGLPSVAVRQLSSRRQQAPIFFGSMNESEPRSLGDAT